MDTLTPPQNGNGHHKVGIKCTEVYYERTINTGKYENEKIGLTLQVEEVVKASEALEYARKFVNQHGAKSAVTHRAPFS